MKDWFLAGLIFVGGVVATSVPFLPGKASGQGFVIRPLSGAASPYLYEDDFERTEDPLSDGGNWTNVSGTSWTAHETDGSEAVGQGSAGHCSFVNSITPNDDQFAEVKVVASTDSASAVVRQTSSTAGDGFIVFTDGGGTQFKVYEMTGSGTSYNQLGSTQSYTFSGGEWLGLSAEGSSPNITLRVWIDGVEEYTLTSQSGADSGQPGIHCYGSGTAAHITDFRCGNGTP